MSQHDQKVTAPISRRQWLRSAAAFTLAASGAAANRSRAGVAQPNIILIVADDLGYGELGSYGQQTIQTPQLDRLAAEGMRFTQFYAGSTVCAPSRGCLMTGLHTGHGPIRGNGLQFLRPEDVTMAEMLDAAGYDTIGFGKWGLGDSWTRGTPDKQGFDTFFGYLNHLQAHNYYPSHLFYGDKPIPIPGNVRPFEKRETYSHDLFTELAIGHIMKDRTNPYFLYLPYTIPHANTVGSWLGAEGMPVPDDAPYSNEPWPQTQRNHAAMITRMDRDIGRILDTVEAMGQTENTLIIFTSDNGPHREGGADPEFFNSAGGLRGIKRDLYEGGIRVPMIARWPGSIEAGSESHLPGASWDFMPTFAEAADVAPPNPTDGVSILPTLIGETNAGRAQDIHDALYWEFNEQGFTQAVRMGDWKGLRRGGSGPVEVYDLLNDPGETMDLGAARPDVAMALAAAMDQSSTEPDTGFIRVKPVPRRKTFWPWGRWRRWFR